MHTHVHHAYNYTPHALYLLSFTLKLVLLGRLPIMVLKAVIKVVDYNFYAMIIVVLSSTVSSSFTFGLTSCRMYSFLSSCHRFAMGLRSEDSAGVFHQLMTYPPSTPLLYLTCFGVIVLHEFMPLWIHPLGERYQRLVQDVKNKHCIHDPLKYTDSSSSSSANPDPHMNFHGVLDPIIKTWRNNNMYTLQLL